MPDRRVPRGSKLDTPGGEDTAYPLNDGGCEDYREEKKEEEQRVREIEEEKREKDAGAPKRLNSGVGIGGFGVKPMTDVLSNSRRDTHMSHSERFITLSYADVLEFVSGDSILMELIDYLHANDENTYNPPTREEFGQMLKFAIRRESGKIDSDDINSAKARASGRASSSPSSKKEYADPANMAFPVDSLSRARTAHAYIHKYWDSPSKKGVTATYGRDDFIRVHKKIVNAMKKFGIEHNHLDGLDDASGFKKESDQGTTNKSEKARAIEPCIEPCDKKEKAIEPCIEPCDKKDKTTSNRSAEAKAIEPCIEPCDKKDKAIEPCEVKNAASGAFFKFHEGQSVVSFARSRMKEKGRIVKMDGAVATVEWESSGLVVPELLAGLIPSF